MHRTPVALFAAVALALTGCAREATPPGPTSRSTPDAGVNAESSQPRSASPGPASTTAPIPSDSDAPPTITWELAEAFGGQVTELYADGELWVAGGWTPDGGPAAWTSGDAVTWLPSEVENQQPDELFAGPRLGPMARLGDSLLSYGTFVGCCDGRGVYGWRSADGGSWEAIESSSSLFEHGYVVRDIAAGEPALVAIENQFAVYAGRIWRWTESTSWVETTPAGGGQLSGVAVDDVVWSQGRFVVVGGRASAEGGFIPDGASWVSTDGQTWEESPPSPDLAGFIISTVAPLPNGGFAALANPESPGSSSPAAVAFTSPDGLHWAASQPLGEGPGFGSSLVEVPGGLVAFIGLATWTSSDGIAWTEAGPLDGVVVAAAVVGNAIVVFTWDPTDATTAIQRGVIAP